MMRIAVLCITATAINRRVAGRGGGEGRGKREARREGEKEGEKRERETERQRERQKAAATGGNDLRKVGSSDLTSAT